MHKIAPPYTDPAPLFRHGGAAYEVGPYGDAPLLDFSVNVNPLGPPRTALEGLPSAWSAVFGKKSLVGRYPDPEKWLLAKELGTVHGVDPSQIVVGNGSSEIILALPRAVKSSRVAIVEPTYTEYLRSSSLAGAAVDHWLGDPPDFQPEPFDPVGVDLIWLCNPNNPTGRLWPRNVLQSWIAANPKTVFALDEAFLPFLADAADHSLIPFVNEISNLIVIRSMTKFHALAGLRLGYAVASPSLASELRKQLTPWSVNSLAQFAGFFALTDKEHESQTHRWFQGEAVPFAGRLAACSSCLEPIPSRANFVLVRLKDVTAGWLVGRLRERGIAIRDASNFVGLDQHYVRIAVRKPEENERLFRELRVLFREG